MTCIINTKSKRYPSATLAAGLAISVFLLLGTFVASASAEEHRGDDHRGGDHRGDRGHGDWRGGYYPPPPVVYAAPSPYYYPPPVVYAPGIGINLPGISVLIR
ncbi:MAG: hypothetical protein WAN51_13940 [Alphaproteobacteria bacterium]